MSKRYILIAGVNGAGKSTLYSVLGSLPGIERVNIDDMVREFGDWRNPKDVFKAGKNAVEKIRGFFKSGTSFNQETTLCGNSIIRNIDNAKELGYYIELHYVGVDSAEIAKNRIKHRVEQGGHDIPDADVERRFFESFKRLKMVLPKCDMVALYDNTEQFDMFAIYYMGSLSYIGDKLPSWYKKYVIDSDFAEIGVRL